MILMKRKMTMSSTKMREENRTNLLDLPNKYRNFDGEFSASCGLDNAEELLIHSQSYFIEWFQQGYSFHQFAEKFAHQDFHYGLLMKYLCVILINLKMFSLFILHLIIILLAIFLFNVSSIGRIVCNE